MCRHINTYMHINHLSQSHVLMRQEREGCMCVANVIPSHQMACFFFCLFFLPKTHFFSSPIFFDPLSFLLFLLHLLFQLSHHSHFLLLLTSPTCVFTASPALFFFCTYLTVHGLSLPHCVILSRTHYHQSISGEVSYAAVQSPLEYFAMLFHSLMYSQTHVEAPVQLLSLWLFDQSDSVCVRC